MQLGLDRGSRNVQMVHLGRETIVATASASGLTIPAGTKLAWVQAQGVDFRAYFSGGQPTTASGHVISASNTDPLAMPIEAVASARVIGLSAGSGNQLEVNYWG